MNNYDRALQLTSVSAESAGKSDERYAAYEESVAGKLKSIQASLEKIVDTMINSDFIRGLLSVVQVFLKIFEAVQKATGGLTGWVIVMASVVKVLQALNSKSKGVALILSYLQKLGIWLTGGTGTLKSFVSALFTFGSTETVVAGETAGLTTSIGALTTSLLASPLFAIVGVVAGVTAFVAIMDKMNTSFKEQKQTVDDLTNSISSLESEKQNLETKGNLTSQEKARLSYLKAELEIEKQKLAIENQKLYKEDVQTKGGDDQIGSDFKKMFGFKGNTSIAENSGLKSETSAYDRLTAAKKRMTDAEEKMNEAIAYGNTGDQDSIDNLKKLTDESSTATEEYKSLYSQYVEFLDKINGYGLEGTEAIAKADQDVYTSAQMFVEAQSDVADSADSSISAFKSADDAFTNLSTSSDELNTNLSSIKDSLTEVGNAFKEMSDDGHLSISTVMSMIDSNSDLLASLKVVNGQYVIDQQTLQSLFETKKQEAIQDLKNNIEEQEAVITKSKNTIAANNAILQSNDGLNESVKRNIASLLGVAAVANYVNAKYSNADLKAQNKSLSANIDSIQSSITIDKKKIEALSASAMNISNYSGVTNEATSATNSNTSATKENTDAVNAESAALKEEKERLQDVADAAQKVVDNLNDEKDKMNAIAKAIEKILQKEIDALNDQKTASDDLFDSKISALQDEETALEDQQDTEDKLLEIEQARVKLEEEKNNKSNRIYSAQAGWYWGADSSKVSEAEQNLADLQKKWKREQEKKAIEDMIKELQKEKTAAAENIQSQIDSLNKLKNGWSDATDTTMTNLNKWEGALDYVRTFEASNFNTRIGMMNDYTSKYVNLCNQIIDAEKAAQKAKEDAEAASAAYSAQQANVSSGSSSGSYSGGGSSGGGSSYHTPTVTYKYGPWEIVRKYQVPGVTGYFYSMRQKVSTMTDGVETSSKYNTKTERSSSASSQASKFYAGGGVDTEGGAATLHGKPNAPEVIFNASQAKALYGFVKGLTGMNGSTSNGSSKNTGQTITISKMEINAPNGSTFDSIINTARQRINTTR